MADSIYTFDPVAANNTALDTIPYGPNQLYHNQIDNWFRALGSKLAQFVDDLGAVNTVAGTGDAVTVTLASGITAYATGQFFRFIAGAANTGAATMNVNAIGAKAIRKISGGTDVALSAGDLAAGATYEVVYRASANAAAGAWVIVGSAAPAAATTSAAGIVELATQTEAATLTDSSRAITADGLFFLGGYTATATAAGTTTLTVTSTRRQYFTGTTTQTVVLPVTSTLVLGRTFLVVNNSTGAVTVQSSGANTILILAAGAAAEFTCILTSGTTAASWDYRPLGITLGTPIALSGSAVDWTSLPAWPKRFTINLVGFGTSGTAMPLVQIGDSGGIASTGYLGTGTSISSGSSSATHTSGMGFGNAWVAASVMRGKVVIEKQSGATNTWTISSQIGDSNAGRTFIGTSEKSLSGVLDRVRLSTTDAFDGSGEATLSWE